ncbi:hypothetical protein AS594_25800 [Streptomyces agglomeratus]|uniref:DUF4184 domain-containing protein n=1 Tax=Streptomyces agglomeratus TaxID=285458 RepID=A0A1E5PDD1_9ACTN|nr:DUF4184 family protein [Streptomyces agglomeratus]OEJ27384.1 hypothetical protein AS594_25800 [Streptomyces agglomeratus]
MPFTLSHAAAVLPGIRRDGTGRGPLLASALVAGSFAPDMTYFAATAAPAAMSFGDVTHSLPGLVTVDVLITAALVGLWLLMREPLVALVPRRRQARFHGFVRGEDWSGTQLPALAWRFFLSAAIGSCTHVFWDSFTHLDRWGMKVLPVLSEIVAGFPMYLYAQYGGSAVALVVIVWFTVSALRRRPDGPAPVCVPLLDARGRWAAWGLLALCVLAGVVHRCVRWYAAQTVPLKPLDFVPTACFGAGAGLAVGLVLYALAVRLWPRRAEHRDSAATADDLRSPAGRPQSPDGSGPRPPDGSGPQAPDGTTRPPDGRGLPVRAGQRGRSGG